MPDKAPHACPILNRLPLILAFGNLLPLGVAIQSGDGLRVKN